MMQTIVIKKGETVQITVETLENYPFPVTWHDAFNVAVNKIRMETTPPSQPVATPVAQPESQADPAHVNGTYQAA